MGVLLGMMRELYAHDCVAFHEDKARCTTLELMRLPEYGRVSIIEHDGEVAGYVVLAYGFSVEYGGRHGFIDELFVRDEFRGQGLGTLAVEYVTGVCRMMGMKVILLEVALENGRARELYGRLGFGKHGRWLMSRRIEP